MVMIKTYKGYINGVYGIFRGNKPKDMTVEEEVEVYYPDDGKVFVRNGEEFPAVILSKDETIDDYEELKRKDGN